METATLGILGMDTTVGEIVKADYRTSEVFERQGIDFCCGGNLSLASACRKSGVDPKSLLQELRASMDGPGNPSMNFASWDPAFLTEYIRNIHHTWLRENNPKTAAYLAKIAEVHGDRHPELLEIEAIFTRVDRAMTPHLEEEETRLFPAIREWTSRKEKGEAVPESTREAISESLAKMRTDHDEIGDAVHAIKRLAADYRVPEDACNTYRVAFQRLKEFEDQLHMHVHLENNVLLPAVTV